MRFALCFLQIGPHSDKSICDRNTSRLGCKIPINVRRLPEKLTKIPDDPLHRPLRRKPKRAKAVSLPSKVGERVDALANEVKAVRFPLTVDELEVDNPLKEELVRLDQLLS